MNELEIYNSLATENLFDLFKFQLKKDFETCALNSDFIDNLPQQYDLLKLAIMQELTPLLNNNSTLQNLLYRIDISEFQIKNYAQTKSNISFNEILSELIIKRILQKVILKKKFSPK
jgi:hypothetical protein